MVEIDIKLVQQAKSDLGERAAEIIADGMGLEKWDSKHLKACCPYHSEKTPSFSWNKKNNSFKCFGCGESLDIIGYYQREGLSFREATRKLFDEVGISYNSDPMETPRKKDKEVYKQPKQETLKAEGKAQQYLELRKISKATINYAGVKEDKQSNIVFEYYDSKDRLMLTKYRPSRKMNKGENKTWCQKDADTSPILYGMHQANPNNPLLITEGEIDRLAAIESGFKNAVSIPFGAENYHWIEHNWEWLEQFNEIIIWSDNDVAGENMRKEVIPRLGKHKTKYVRSTFQDINLQLFKAGKESVMKSIESAIYVPIEDIVDMAQVEDYNPDDMEKIKSGLNGLDKFIGGWFLGTLNVITGINGSGKSTFINQSCVCESVNQGYKTFVMSGELTKQQLRNWIEYPMAGKENITTRNNGVNAPNTYYVDKRVKEKMREWYKEKVYIYDNDLDYTAESILKKMEELARRYGVKVFLLDNLMTIDLRSNQFDINIKQKDFVKELVFFARRYNAVVHLVAHPRKTDTIQRLSKMDVAGSGDITNLAHYVTAIHRVSDKEKEDKLDKNNNIIEEGCPFDCIVDLFKNRPMGYQDKSVGVKYDIPSKRFYGESDDLDKIYKWESTEAPDDFQLVIDKNCPF